MGKYFKKILKKNRLVKVVRDTFTTKTKIEGNFTEPRDTSLVEQDDLNFVLERIRKTFKGHEPTVHLPLKSGSTENVVKVELEYYHTTLRYVFFLDSSGPSTFSTTNSNAYSVKIGVGTLDTLEKRNLFTNQLKSTLMKKLVGIYREYQVIEILKEIINNEEELFLEHSIDLDNIGIDVLIRYGDTNHALCFDVKSRMYDVEKKPPNAGKTIMSGRFDKLLKFNKIETIIYNENHSELKKKLEKKVNNFLHRLRKKQKVV